ncbi:hypothetical protein OF83DRAFT_1281208 [Amylostereum chailletii]|nr:hypothetical protein OF83DRAFT_1281208 [Amylostereum chailletii]
MVKLLLSIKAELENVTDLVPASDDFEYFFEVKCSSCNEKHPKFVSLNRLEEHEVSAGKGSSAHFVWRCGFCKRESTAKFDAASPPQPYTADANGQFSPFLTLDCRGLEFVGFDPRGVWTCVGAESGTKFNEVEYDNSEGWVDYDEKAAVPVGISDLEFYRYHSTKVSNDNVYYQHHLDMFITPLELSHSHWLQSSSDPLISPASSWYLSVCFSL